MPALDQVVQVQISQATAAVAQASFGIPLIVGPSNPGWTSTDYVHAYSSAAALLADGYISSNPEYLWALALMAQPITPSQFLVARRTTPAVAEVGTFTMTGSIQTGHTYNITLDGATYGFSGGGYTAQAGDSALTVLTAMLAALTGGLVPFTGAVTGTGASAVLTYTAKTAGVDIKWGASGTDPQFVRTVTTPASSFATDIAKARAQNDTWYGMVYAQATDAQILEVAAWAEAQKKIFLAASTTSAIAGSGSSDVASSLKTAGYKRTALVYSVAGIGQGIEAAWLGGQLPQTPGSNNWAFKSLNGVSADSLTDTQRSNLVGNPVAGIVGKNANIYTPLGGINVTQFGTMASGQYIDITVGIDWLQATLQTNVWAALANAKKLPYTDAGAAVIIQAVRQAIDQGVANGLIAPDGISVTAPAVLAVSSNQRAQRIAPTVSFACRLQGAFNSVTISGVVTV